MKFDDPAWVAGVLAIIAAMTTMIVTVVGVWWQGKKLTANTKLTEETRAQGQEIKSLVNGSQTALLSKIEASEKALDAAHGEVRAMRELFSLIAPNLRLPEGASLAAIVEEMRNGSREPLLALPHDPSRVKGDVP